MWTLVATLHRFQFYVVVAPNFEMIWASWKVDLGPTVKISIFLRFLIHRFWHLNLLILVLLRSYSERGMSLWLESTRLSCYFIFESARLHYTLRPFWEIRCIPRFDLIKELVWDLSHEFFLWWRLNEVRFWRGFQCRFALCETSDVPVVNFLAAMILLELVIKMRLQNAALLQKVLHRRNLGFLLCRLPILSRRSALLVCWRGQAVSNH